MECCCNVRNIQDLLSDGKTPFERRFGMPFDGPVIPFISRLHQFGPKILPGIFLGYVLYAGGIWTGDIVIADIEEMEEMDASELRARRLNAKEVLTPMKGDNLIFPVADGTVKTFGGDRCLKPSTISARRKLEIPMPAAMLCKTPINCCGETCRNIGKTRQNTLVLLMPTNLWEYDW